MRKIPAPRVLPETIEFWKAADEGRYVVKKCIACQQVHYYPRDICPFCLSAETEWQESAGTGIVYSFSTMGKDESAYTVAYITLDEGFTVMSNLVGCDPQQVKLGQKVRVVFQPTEGGHAVPMFTPV